MEQLKKNKKAFISLGMCLFFARMENGALLLWKIFKNGTGGRGFFLVPDAVFVWKNEVVEFKKINLENPALGSRLHACSAWEVNVTKDFVFVAIHLGFFYPVNLCGSLSFSVQIRFVFSSSCFDTALHLRKFESSKYGSIMAIY